MPPVKSRRELYSEATRAALIEQGITLFAERGFSATSLADIATATQVTRGAVYHHFSGGKQALFEAVLDELESRAVRQVSEAAGAATDAWDSAMLGLDAFLDHCCDPVYGRLVWQEGPVALGWTAWKKCEEKYAYGLIEQFVASLTEAGYLQPTPRETTVRFLFSMLGAAGLTLADVDDDERRRVRDECGDLMRRLLGGLRA